MRKEEEKKKETQAAQPTQRKLPEGEPQLKYSSNPTTTCLRIPQFLNSDLILFGNLHANKLPEARKAPVKCSRPDCQKPKKYSMNSVNYCSVACYKELLDQIKGAKIIEETQKGETSAEIGTMGTIAARNLQEIGSTA